MFRKFGKSYNTTRCDTIRCQGSVFGSALFLKLTMLSLSQILFTWARLFESELTVLIKPAIGSISIKDIDFGCYFEFTRLGFLEVYFSNINTLELKTGRVSR